MKHFVHHRGESDSAEERNSISPSSDPGRSSFPGEKGGKKTSADWEENPADPLSSSSLPVPEELVSSAEAEALFRSGTDRTPSSEETGRFSAGMLPREKKYALWILFREFFKIALFVVGGGFAILLVAEDVFVRKYPWLREGELSDMLALIQTVPGLTAGNVAIYVGYRVAGLSGALTALTAVALPSFLVITLVAMGFALIPMESAFVRGAFLGVRTAMTGLMLVALARIWKGSVRSPVQLLIFLAGIAGVVVFHVNPGWLIAGALLAGVLYCMGICRVFPRALPKGGI